MLPVESGPGWDLGLGSSAPSVHPESSSGRVPMSLPLLEALQDMVKERVRIQLAQSF